MYRKYDFDDIRMETGHLPGSDPEEGQVPETLVYHRPPFTSPARTQIYISIIIYNNTHFLFGDVGIFSCDVVRRPINTVIDWCIDC